MRQKTHGAEIFAGAHRRKLKSMKNRYAHSFRSAAFGLAMAVLTACAVPPGRVRLPPTPAPENRAAQSGIASWYGPGFHGQATARGDIYNQDDLTAAHQTLPLGTRVMVTNLTNGKSIEVLVNDRGPFAKGRIIDLSHAAARSIDMVGAGTAPVRIERLVLA